MSETAPVAAPHEEPPIVISVENVAKRFIIHQDKSIKDRLLHPNRTRQHAEDFWALRDLSVDIRAGNTIGLIGPNGSGKSTLLKVIGGILEPTRGRVLHRGRIAALLELGAGFHHDLTGRENVFLNASILGLSKEETEARFDEIVEFSGIEKFIDTQVKFYSSGMYVRLAFAVAVHCDPDILLVDEVLAVGDEPFQNKCLNKIREFQEEGRTIIMVSHNLSQITDFCTRALVLGQGNVIYDGDPDQAVEILRQGFRTIEEASAVRERIERERAREANAQNRHSLGRIREIRALPNRSPMQPGTDLEVEVDFETVRAIEKWDLGLSLTNGLGQMVLMTSSSRAGLRTAPLDAGTHTVRFRLPDLSLPRGEYTLSAAFYDETSFEVHRLNDAASVVADTDDRSAGLQYTAAVASVS